MQVGEVIQMFARDDPARGVRILSAEVNEAAFAARYAGPIMDLFAQKLVEKLVEMWLAAHASEVINGLSGEEMTKVIQKHIAERALQALMKEG
jgi:hypothetical protein